MVDKVNGQKYYEYAKINQTKRKSVDSPEFHLDAEKQGVIYEKSEEKKKAAKAEAEKDAPKTAQGSVSSGVRIEISRHGREQTQREDMRADFAGQVRKFAQAAVTFLKSLWDKIWNEPAEDKQIEFPEILEERIEKAEAGTDMYSAPGEIPGEFLRPGPVDVTQPNYTKEEIRAIFRRGNQKEIENFLSDNGRRHLVKNSDLLTQYDKTGMIIGVDRSDKDLILHGNKNEIKL